VFSHLNYAAKERPAGGAGPSLTKGSQDSGVDRNYYHFTG